MHWFVAAFAHVSWHGASHLTLSTLRAPHPAPQNLTLCSTKEKTAHVAVPVIIAGALLSCFGAVARVSAPGGFALLTLSLGLAFAGQSTLVARAAGERCDFVRAGAALRF